MDNIYPIWVDSVTPLTFMDEGLNKFIYMTDQAYNPKMIFESNSYLSMYISLRNPVYLSDTLHDPHLISFKNYKKGIKSVTMIHREATSFSENPELNQEVEIGCSIMILYLPLRCLMVHPSLSWSIRVHLSPSKSTFSFVPFQNWRWTWTDLYFHSNINSPLTWKENIRT